MLLNRYTVIVVSVERKSKKSGTCKILRNWKRMERVAIRKDSMGSMPYLYKALKGAQFQRPEHWRGSQSKGESTNTA